VTRSCQVGVARWRLPGWGRQLLVFTIRAGGWRGRRRDGQTDMRGLVTAGRVVRPGRCRLSRFEQLRLIVETRVSSGYACRSGRERLVARLHSGQGVAPAGEFAGDREVGDHGPLVSLVKGEPAFVEAPVGEVRAGGYRPGCVGPPAEHGVPRPVGRLVVPGGLNQKPAGMGVPGLGNTGQDPFLTAGGFTGNQAEVGPKAGGVEPGPVPDLDGETEPGQSRDSS